jgi:enoyl-CoA hydratase
MGPTRRRLSKPVTAAVAGHAVAGGLELALRCDLRVAEEDAVFGAFCRRWGVPLIDGGTVRRPRLIGTGRALDLILTGRPVPAAEALGMGLADRVVPPGRARAAAEELAARIARFPQSCLRSDRAFRPGPGGSGRAGGAGGGVPARRGRPGREPGGHRAFRLGRGPARVVPGPVRATT